MASFSLYKPSRTSFVFTRSRISSHTSPPFSRSFGTAMLRRLRLRRSSPLRRGRFGLRTFSCPPGCGSSGPMFRHGSPPGPSGRVSLSYQTNSPSSSLIQASCRSTASWMQPAQSRDVRDRMREQFYAVRVPRLHEVVTVTDLAAREDVMAAIRHGLGAFRMAACPVRLVAGRQHPLDLARFQWRKGRQRNLFSQRCLGAMG
jgi:hypothetical protein